MNETPCSVTRDRLPDHAAGRLDRRWRDAVAAHLDVCAECRAEAELVQALWASRARAPEGLADRILSAATAAGVAGPSAGAPRSGTGRAAPPDGVVPAERGGPGRPRSARRRLPGWMSPLPALAAALVVALGTGLLWNELRTDPDAWAGLEEAADRVEADDVLASAWPSDDGMLAGSPALDDLTEEDLLALLEEMEP